jgi:hypothetical protein
VNKFSKILFLTVILTFGLYQIFINANLILDQRNAEKKLYPDIGSGSNFKRLGYPNGEANSSSFTYLFLQKDGKTGVAWDPCREIHFVISNINKPEYGYQVIINSLNEIAEITGYKFIFDGYTNEKYSSNRNPYLPNLYGDVWAPILFSWSKNIERPELDRNVLGEGSGILFTRDGNYKIYVSGLVDIEIENVMRNIKGIEKIEALMKHEITHVIGLGHSSGAWDLMYPEERLNVIDFSPGDKSGLINLANSKCFPEI